jgi:EpsI family protein
MKSSHRLLWIALALSVVLALSWQLFPLADSGDRLQQLPPQGWRLISRDMPLTPTEKSIFGQARVLKRLYQADGQRVVLVGIDGSQERHAVHDPLYCFRGAGWEVESKIDLSVPGGVARRLILGKGPEKAEAVYWISNGQVRHTSPLRYWWQATWRRLTLGRSGAEPVLIILQPATGEGVRWEKLFQSFPGLFEI